MTESLSIDLHNRQQARAAPEYSQPTKTLSFACVSIVFFLKLFQIRLPAAGESVLFSLRRDSRVCLLFYTISIGLCLLNIFKSKPWQSLNVLFPRVKRVLSVKCCHVFTVR